MQVLECAQNDNCSHFHGSFLEFGTPGVIARAKTRYL